MFNLAAIIIAIFLVLLNAFFVAAEFGIVKLRQTRVQAIKESYGIRGRVLAEIHQHLDAYLSACQLGITLASLGLGWVGEPAFAVLIRPLLTFIGVDAPELIEITAFTIAFIFISFLHIVVGELMPKSLAIRQAEQISLWTAVPLYLFYWLMYPAIWILNGCARLLLRMSGLQEPKDEDSEQSYSSEELRLILSSSHIHGQLNKEESEILSHTLDFVELQVTDVMRPLEEMVKLELQESIDKALEKIISTRYSRYPVYDDKTQQIVGIVHVKDLFAAMYQYKTITDLRPLLRPILKVPKHVLASELLRKFREGMSHFAVVYSSIDNPIGFVTLDNLLQVFVGRIKDEFHRTGEDWSVAVDGAIIMQGNSPIYAIERALDIDIFTEEDVTTLGGLILQRLGALPKQGEKIEFEQFIALVEKMTGPKIVRVRIYPKKM